MRVDESDPYRSPPGRLIDTATLQRLKANRIKKHYGPGPHASGSPQSVHGGGLGGTGAFTEESERVSAIAETLEDLIDQDLLLTEQESGGELYGLTYKRKSLTSIQSKMRRNMEEARRNGERITVKEAADRVTDLNRYTLRWMKDEYPTGVRAAVDSLSRQGWEVYDSSAKNAWLPSNPYAGINAKFTNSAGVLFELQFHTMKTTKIKAISDPIYAVARELPEGDAKRVSMVNRMNALWNKNRAKWTPSDAVNVFGQPTVFTAKAEFVVRYFVHYNANSQVDAEYRVLGVDTVEVKTVSGDWVRTGRLVAELAGHGGDSYHEVPARLS